MPRSLQNPFAVCNWKSQPPAYNHAMFTRKWIVRTAAVLCLLLIGLGLWMLLHRDAPVNDADLMPDTTPVRDEDNGYAVLKDVLPSLVMTSVWYDQTGKLDVRTNWNAELVDKLLAPNADALAAWRVATQKPRFKLPPVPPFPDGDEVISQVRRLSRLQLLECQRLFHSGRELEAFESALGGVRLGHALVIDADTIHRMLVGRAIKESNLKWMQRHLPITLCNTKELMGIANELTAYHAYDKTLENPLKGEYQQFKAYLADVNKLADGELSRWDLAFTKLTMSKSKTAALMAAQTRTWLQDSSKFGREMSQLQRTAAITNVTSAVRFIGKGNWSGRILFEMLAGFPERALLTKCRENNTLHATRLLLALRCYQNDHGALPASLADLTPKYLKAIPLDDYDGLPFRYSREKKLLYSVGEDFKDDGGVEKDSKGERLDDVYPIEF